MFTSARKLACELVASSPYSLYILYLGAALLR
jgi:hypothetical protein